MTHRLPGRPASMKSDRRMERGVDPMAERMDLGGLPRPGEHDRGARARLEVGGGSACKRLRRRRAAAHPARPRRVRGRQRARRCGSARAAAPGDDPTSRPPASRPARRRIGAGNPAASAICRASTNSRRIANLLRAEADRIGIEHQHDPHVAQAGNGGQRATEGQHGAFARRIIVDGLVAIPFCLRQALMKSADLADQRRRSYSAGQQGESRRPLARALLVRVAVAAPPRTRSRMRSCCRARRLRAVGIVERQRAPPRQTRRLRRGSPDAADCRRS